MFFRLIALFFCFLGLASCQQQRGEANNYADTVTPLAIDSAKIKLGHHLFFDQRLSATGTKSCSGCHDPVLSFTDGYRRSPGAFADLHRRNTPTLLNVSRQRYFNWADTTVKHLTHQMDGPLFGNKPVEMGLTYDDREVLLSLENDSDYSNLWKQAFPERKGAVDWPQVKESLSAYLRQLTSFDAPYDRYVAGDSSSLDAEAIKGKALFFSVRLACSTCHRPPMFGADSTMSFDEQFVNIGLYNIQQGYPPHDQGLSEITNRTADRGRFRIPTLRNVSWTAPYFHDGSAETLDDVLDVYEQGGREIRTGVWAGDGRLNPGKHPLIKKRPISQKERAQLIAFLKSLSDSSVFTTRLFHAPITTRTNDKL